MYFLLSNNFILKFLNMVNFKIYSSAFVQYAG